MENASKALIMAAEILIGVMILSIMVYVFSSMADYSSKQYDRISEIQLSEFNAQFLKYYGNGQDGKPIKCTIHDIVGLVDLAQQENITNELVEKIGDKYKRKTGITLTNSFYIQIDLGSISNLELKSNNDLVALIKANDLKLSATGTKSDIKYYKCVNCETKGTGNRINYVKFVELP